MLSSGYETPLRQRTRHCKPYISQAGLRLWQPPATIDEDGSLVKDIFARLVLAAASLDRVVNVFGNRSHKVLDGVRRFPTNLSRVNTAGTRVCRKVTGLCIVSTYKRQQRPTGAARILTSPRYFSISSLDNDLGSALSARPFCLRSLPICSATCLSECSPLSAK